jgi:hypothetical protein
MISRERVTELFTWLLAIVMIALMLAILLGAARATARRGKLRISVPVGYIWHREIGLRSGPVCVGASYQP